MSFFFSICSAESENPTCKTYEVVLRNQICIANNPVQHDGTKHIEWDKKFFKEKLDTKIICSPYVCSWKQLVHMLTKGLS